MNVGVVAGVILGAVMLSAGAAKLASRTWTAQAANLRVPTAAAAAVPWVELVLGAGLIAQLAPIVFAVATAGLVVGFTVLLSSLLVRGQRPPCACFGGGTPKPISWLSVARNVALLGLAAMTALAS